MKTIYNKFSLIIFLSLSTLFIGCAGGGGGGDSTTSSSPVVTTNALSISGTPQTNISLYRTYHFLPTVNNPDNETLIFTIQNKPAWADFNTSTGLLSGVVTSESDYLDLNISVSGENININLPLFSIKVLPAVDIAHKFGIATQGTDSSYNYYRAPSLVIDANDTSYNHTSGDVTSNWWQLELPTSTEISKIIIKGRSTHTSRLKDAKVYIMQTPYTGTLDANDLVATLEGTGSEQNITVAPTKSGSYLIVKANDTNHLHMATLEVYGKTPIVPVFTENNNDFLISGASSIGDKVTTINTVDYEDRVLTYSIDDSSFDIDNQGNITVKSHLTAGSHNVTVTINNGLFSATTMLNIVVTSSSAIEDIISSGDVINTLVTSDELIEATLNEIENIKNMHLAAKVKIFNFNLDGTVKDDGSSLTSIDWNPTHDASTILSTLGRNTGLLKTNAVKVGSGKTVYNKEIAVIGEKSNARYMVMGANPMRNSVNDDMNLLLENSLSWLTGRDDLKTNSFNVVIAHLDESYYFKDESKTREWLNAHYSDKVNYNDADTCDNTALEGCLKNDTNLLIISQVAKADDNLTLITAAVKQALENNISVLYIHHNGNLKPLGKELFFNVFDVSYEWDNYRKKLLLSSYNPSDDIAKMPTDLIKIKTMFTHFKNEDYSFDWSLCDQDDCSALTSLQSQFQDGASITKTIIDNFDKNKKNIFKDEGYRIQKLLILTADKFRQEVVYPMDKVTTDDNEFMKSYYSDHAVYNYRDINPTQKDMGNFSRSDFSHITPINKTINLVSKSQFRAAGVYMLPGITMKVTRVDSSAVNTSVFINSIQSGATHIFEEATSMTKGYNRPKYLQTQKIEIKSGETISLTSPYGGPVQIYFNKNDLNVSFNFENIGEHPFWASSADDISFSQKLSETNYDWAEVVTAGFEVHSKLTLMEKSVNDPKWGTAAALATAIQEYIGTYPYILAGYKMQEPAMVAEIYTFADDNNITMQTVTRVQHMNADQATCGYGCSGNPYDAYWAFSPIGHGDVHELGHGLERSRFQFEGFEQHATTNPYSYYTKSKYNENTGGGEPDCQNLPFKEVFEKLNQSVNETNSTQYLQTNLWENSNWSQQVLVTIQAMMHSQKMGKLENGWHLLARLHLLEREIKIADDNWQERRDDLGFSSYTLDEFNTIRNNDWLLISFSFAANLDFRNYLTMMGIEYSQKASNQVESFHYDIVPNEFFISTPDGYCKTDAYGTYLNKNSLAVDGNSAWPE